MKSENDSISIDSIGFLIRHPWLFLCPLVVIGSIVFSYASLVPSDYESSAVLSFGIASGTLPDPKFIQKKEDIATQALLGKNIAAIIKEVWPEISETADPVKYNKLMSRLRDPNGGISIKYDKRDPNLLIISFRDRDPKSCYKIVQATIDAIKLENKETFEEKMGVSLTFLQKQLDFYREKLRSVDEEMSRVKNELKGVYSQLTPQERDLINEIVSEPAFKESKGELVIQKSAKYEEILADLNLQLLEAEKRRSGLKSRLERKDFTPQFSYTQPIEDDPVIKQYSKTMMERELELSDLFSKGYTSIHPNAKKLRQSIEDLKALKEKRIEELSAKRPELSEDGKRLAGENLKSEINDMDNIIETLKDKITLMEKYQKASEDKLRPVEARTESVSSKASRLMELKNEKDINTVYYTNVRKQLEEAQMKSRMEKSSAGFIITVVEEPRMPVNPIPLKKASILFVGLFVALGSGCGLSYIADSLDKTVKSASELRQILQIPVLASIDKISSPHEVRFLRVRRNIIIISLILFTLSSRFFVKIALLILS